MTFDNVLLEVLGIQSPSRLEDRMIDYLRIYAKNKGYHYKEIDRNVYLTKGRNDLYPCFVAHTDTCASIIPSNEYGIFHDKGQTLFGYNTKTDKQTQVGFDDKVGIFIALQMMESQPYAKGFFPHSEEIGCIGSGRADMSFFDDCTYAIQCDRSGNKGITDEIGWVTVLSDEFKQVIGGAMSTHNRKFVSGIMTDVQTLKSNGLKVVCMNIECGYYNPHRNDDFVVVDEMYDTLQFVKDIVKDAGIRKYEHEYVDKYANYNTGWKRYDDKGEWDEYNQCTWYDNKITCENCGIGKFSNDYYQHLDLFMCLGCYHELVGTFKRGR